jgi:hypothetical protein
MLVFAIYVMMTLNASPEMGSKTLYVGHVHHIEDVVAAENNVAKAFESRGFTIDGWKVDQSTEI